MNNTTGGPPQVAVPDVVNVTRADAETALTSVGLVIGTAATASSPTVAAGNIIRTEPSAGTLIHPGSAVNLEVSVGPPQLAVPDVEETPNQKANRHPYVLPVILSLVGMAIISSVAYFLYFYSLRIDLPSFSINDRISSYENVPEHVETAFIDSVEKSPDPDVMSEWREARGDHKMIAYMIYTCKSNIDDLEKMSRSVFNLLMLDLTPLGEHKFARAQSWQKGDENPELKKLKIDPYIRQYF
jgi:hypothetical protein